MNYATLWALPIFLLPLTSTGQYGELDTTFNAVGYTEDIGQGGGYNLVRNILYKPDGRIRVATGFNYAVETRLLLPNGQRDLDWFTYTEVPVSRPTAEIVERPDGKVVLATLAALDAGTIRLLQYTVDSELDPAFGTDGVVLHPLPGIDLVRICAFTLLDDRKMLLAGTAEGDTEQLVVARFLEDGSLDGTFSGSGLVLLDVADGAAAEDMVLRPDGRILLGGYSMNAGTKQLLLAQLMADGAWDVAFGTGGMVTVDLGFSSQAIQAIALSPEGAVVAAGWVEQPETGTDPLLVSFNPTGQLDTGFGINGWLTVDTEEGQDRYSDVLLDQDGMILTCGTVFWSPTLPQAILTRRTLSGALDPFFGTDGMATLELPFGGRGNCLALQDDGKILVGGNLFQVLYAKGMVARFTAGMPVGITSIEAAPPLIVVPNPATEHIQITLPDGGHGYQLRIHDASGRIVHQEQLGSSAKPIVDVRGFAAGVYQLVLNDDRQVYQASLVIAH